MGTKPVDVFWSRAALSDLDRFAEFLLDYQPQLAAEVADAIITGADVLAHQPMMGRPISGKSFRQLVLHVRNASYVLQYRVTKERLVILRVFHGRERRD